MSDVKTYPTDEAWAYFLKHHDDIRSVVEDLSPFPFMQSMIGPSEMTSKYGLDDFDKAVKSRDSKELYSIMNDAWLRAPESRSVYDVPGFTPICNLLDITIEGFVDDGGDSEESV